MKGRKLFSLLQKKAMYWLGSAVIILSLGASAGFSEEQLYESPEPYYRLSVNVVTPHIAWAKPFSGKRLKALAIGPRWNQRETVELMERLDSDCTPVMLFSMGELFTGPGWSWQNIKALREEEALRKLREGVNGSYDVIIMGQAPVNKFPPDVMEKLKQHINNGAGLVYVYQGQIPDKELEKALRETPAADERQFLLTGIPFENLPSLWVKQREKDLPKIVSLYQYGKGRVVLLNYSSGGFLTPPDSDDLNYEYYQSFLIKAILWAAHREPNVLFQGVPASVTANREQAEAKEVSFTLMNRGEPTQYSLLSMVRSPDPLFQLPTSPMPSPGVHQTNRVLRPVFRAEKKLSLVNGLNPMKYVLPQLPAGDYFLDLQIASGEKKINWATVALTVESKLRILEMKLTPPFIDLRKPKPELKIEVLLSQPLTEAASLDLAILDNYNRLLSLKRLTLSAGQDRAAVVLPIVDIRSILGKVRAELSLRNERVSVKSALFTAMHRPWSYGSAGDDFTFFAWGGVGPGYVDRQRARLLAQFGIDAFRGGSSLASLEVADVRCIPDLWGFGHQGRTIVKDHISQPCYTDPEFRISSAKTLMHQVQTFTPFDPAGYLHGDESALLGGPEDICWSKSCIANLRRFLESEYKTITNLNKEWDTKYSSFSQIIPVTREEMRQRAKTTQNYAPLIDQWRFNYLTFADVMRFSKDTLKELDPSARIGGSTPLWNWWWRGYDWADLMPHFSIFTPYGPWGDISTVEAGRSFAKPGTLLSMHNGSYEPAEYGNETYYRLITYVMLLHGYSNFFWYSDWGDGCPALWPSLEPLPCFKATSDTVKEIKHGIGKLLLGAQRSNDGIAIHYSMPSYLFSWLGPYPQNSYWTVSWRLNTVMHGLEELGFQYDLVSTEDILKGKLAGYRVLILPGSYALGDIEAQKMKQFVENGGILIADVRPGIADAHGKIGGAKTVGSLFGLKWKDPIEELSKQKIAFVGEYKGKKFSGPPVEGLVDRTVALDGASALIEAEGVPLLIHHHVGKGTAICLNTTHSDGLPDVNANERNVMGALLSSHGIDPLVRIKSSQEQFSPGAWMNGFEFSHFSDGKAQYFGLTRRRESGAPASCTLQFPQTGYLYDMRTGKYLGRKETWETKVSPLDVQLYALLPYRVQGIKASVGKSAYSPGEQITGRVALEIGSQKPARHVIHLQVTRPDGKQVRYLAQNLETKTGSVAFEIPLSLNEPKGTWEIAFTDEATKAAKTVKVRVM